MGKYSEAAKAHMRDVMRPDLIDRIPFEEHCDSFEEGAEYAERRIYELLENAPQMNGKRPSLWQELKSWLESQTDAERVDANAGDKK